MATPRSQRIGIWVITVVMAIGAVGVYFVAIIANSNNKNATQKYQQDIMAYQTKVTAQTKQLSDTYYPVLSAYSSRVSTYAKPAAQEMLATVDLKVGDGETIGDTTKFAAYYIGWNPDGKVFGQSIKNNTLEAPLFDNVGLNLGLQNASLIQGWKDGMKGMKIGGVREVTVPSSQAYGSAGKGSDIPPDTPIKFVILAIPPIEIFTAPTPPLTS